MKRKILFIFAFVLLFFIFLNNNSFACDINELPVEFKNNISSTYLSYFSNSDYYITFTSKSGSRMFVIFSNNPNTKIPVNLSSNVYSINDGYKRLFYNYSSSSYSESTTSSLTISASDFILSANYTVYDSRTNNLLYEYIEPTPQVFYNVIYNLNGGTGTSSTVTVQEGESITLWNGSGITPPENMNFVGWSTDSSSSSANVSSPYTPTEDITLYAVYEYNTSGILAGIRNLISSITNGFSSVISNISNILSYINPLSDNFFGYKIVELIVNGLKSLFIPDSENFQNKIDSVKAKFGFVDSIKNTINGLMEIVQDDTNSAVFTINLGKSKYFNGGSVTIIDFSWYAPYKEYGDIIICCFAYIFFFWRIFIHLPGIINGSGGAIENSIEIGKNSRG